MKRNEGFLKTAEELRPSLKVTAVELEGSGRVLKKGDEELFDLGDHYTGYVTVGFESTGRHQDAPLHFQISFYESSQEFSERPSRYHGWISPSWIQEERIHIDVLPCSCRLQRRYAFRYIKIRILSVSSNFSVKINRVSVDAVSSADEKKLIPFRGRREDERLDAVSVRTLHECMQEVFEDGPKRDRRLWLGDLRLQALTNYVTYRDLSLVKRCLYLFAGDTFDDGRVSNNIFIYPEPEMDDQFMFDYSLFFISTLRNYYEESGDIDTLRELEPTAYRQFELSRGCFDERNIAELKKTGPVFVDWKQTLHKQASAQGIYIYCLKDLLEIEKALGNSTSEIESEISVKTQAALDHLYSKKRGLFLSGRVNQVSYASQVWMVLAGVVQGDKAAEVLEKTENSPAAVKMRTPYMYHHYVEALIKCGRKQKAYEKMLEYWGAMLELGADTFYEIFDPKKTGSSPYGGKIIHSYCHAWSCTPAYFLRKYYSEGK
ncbi:MAG: hypothetical protein J6W57_03285 [Oscillospiraceae bacterium]|nr:hypothetical protein [Oscillospiraceae bacterium]MBQ5341012.1 hypothetical protein [Oscillospiraceae bacterium]MBQ5343324.1 hypothetical protein [Oscillospiraceae bacterium]